MLINTKAHKYRHKTTKSYEENIANPDLREQRISCLSQTFSPAYCSHFNCIGSVIEWFMCGTEMNGMTTFMLKSEMVLMLVVGIIALNELPSALSWWEKQVALEIPYECFIEY